VGCVLGAKNVGELMRERFTVKIQSRINGERVLTAKWLQLAV
jgi:hypothetical protein